MQMALSLLHTPWIYVHKLLTWKEGMERKRLSERGEDNNHDLCYRPWSTTEIRQLPVCNLSHLCRQRYACMHLVHKKCSGLKCL